MVGGRFIHDGGDPTIYYWNGYWDDVSQLPSLLTTTIGIGRIINSYQAQLAKVVRCRPNENLVLKLLCTSLAECVKNLSSAETLPIWWRKPSPEQGYALLGRPEGQSLTPAASQDNQPRSDLVVTTDLATMITVPCLAVASDTEYFAEALTEFLATATVYNNLRLEGEWRLPFVYGLVVENNRRAYVITEPNFHPLLTREASDILHSCTDVLAAKLKMSHISERFVTLRLIPNDGFVIDGQTWRSDVIPTYHYYLDDTATYGQTWQRQLQTQRAVIDPMKAGSYDPLTDATFLELAGQWEGVDQLAYLVLYRFAPFDGRQLSPQILKRIVGSRAAIVRRKKGSRNKMNDVNRPESQRNYARAILGLLDRLYAGGERGALSELLPPGETFDNYKRK